MSLELIWTAALVVLGMQAGDEVVWGVEEELLLAVWWR